MKGADFHLMALNEPDASTTDTLPFMVLKSGECIYGDQINAFAEGLKMEEILSADIHTNGEDPMITMLETQLQPVLLYWIWCEPENYRHATRDQYSLPYTWPLNYIVPFLRQRTISKWVESRFKEGIERKEIEKQADDCLRAMSDMLGNHTWFSKSE
jgi:hypothetical protein